MPYIMFCGNTLRGGDYGDCSMRNATTGVVAVKRIKIGKVTLICALLFGR